MDLETLQLIWFAVVLVLLTGYAILDGFDLGVGIIHLFTHTDRERRIMLNSIGPVWDGNEVWLVTGGGALFAGFPLAYATMCSAFYVPVILLLTSLIFRAVAIEFRSKEPWGWWRSTWDTLFCLASLTVSFLLGLILGNLVQGIPLNAEGDFVGTWESITAPYPLLIGLLTVTLFAMHGTLYVVMKTEGEMNRKLRAWIQPCMIAFIICCLTATMATLIYMDHMTLVIKQRPYLFIISIALMMAVANIPRCIAKGKDIQAFLSSCTSIIMLMGLYGLGSFPKIVRAMEPHTDFSLTIFNTSSSAATLKILLFIAALGVPLVLSYTVSIYYIFRGKVKIDGMSL